MKINALPSVEELFERFYVDSTSPSGLRWATKRFKCRHEVGDTAGSIGAGRYWRIEICGVRYPAHRIVQAMKTGADRSHMTVDHIDRNKQNNHPFNLRWATMQEQSLNKTCSNPLGKGVCYIRDGLTKPYRASAWRDGKDVYLGMYSTADAAHQAYLAFTSSSTSR